MQLSPRTLARLDRRAYRVSEHSVLRFHERFPEYPADEARSILWCWLKEGRHVCRPDQVDSYTNRYRIPDKYGAHFYLRGNALLIVQGCALATIMKVNPHEWVDVEDQ